MSYIPIKRTYVRLYYLNEHMFSMYVRTLRARNVRIEEVNLYA